MAEKAISVVVTADALEFTFGDGRRTKVHPAELSAEIRNRAMFHGLEQKIRDAAALGIENVNGRLVRPSAAQKADACFAMIERLMGGEWNKGREGVETGGMLFEAMRRIPRYAESPHLANPAAFREWIEGRANAQGVKPEKIRATLSAVPAISAELDAIRKERGAGLDSDALLETL